MTPSKTVCRQMQQHGLAFIAGDTSALEMQRLKSHLRHCAACREAAAEMSALFEAARAERYLPSSDERDRIWETLQARVEIASQSSEKPSLKRFPARPAPLFFALTAAAAAAIFVLGFLASNVTRNKEMPLRSNDAPASTPDLPELTVVQAATSLFLGTAPGTAYRTEQKGTRYVLTLSRGTVWIRFGKTESIQDLVIEAPGVVVNVIGTVLTVDAAPDRPTTVGVLRGHVRIHPAGGEERSLGEGSLFSVGDRALRSMDTARRNQAAKWLVSLATESAEDTADLTETAEATTDSEPRRAPSPDHPREVVDLYRQAEAHMASKDFAKAAKLLERIIALAPVSARADTARLDLARIYTRSLDRPERAEKHLKAYLARHPKAPNAPMIKRQLCELSKDCDE